MRVVGAAEVLDRLRFPDLVRRLREAFRAGAVTPVRHHHAIARPGEPDATLLLMPAWSDFAAHRDGGHIGVKIVNVFPGNAARGLPSVAGVYVLMSGETGAPLAVIDGHALTVRRTAAASALAASFLARADARRLVMVGAGALAPHLIEAHASIRPIEEVLIWNRHAARAEALARSLAGRPFSVGATEDLAAAVRGADIVSCATLASDPVVPGAWLSPGTHLDLVGGFTPAMRETDDEAVAKATLFVDTRDGALAEAGDLVQPLRSGLISASGIAGDLFELCRGSVPGRRSESEITLFKSVGTALEDLAAATALAAPH
ncbi:ornithine cyclodeaminase family protein [Propylenella binzhouense]|uniref:Ornithine cyclodeaminase family protein n=1 Tax=Propylenella binzhouense TaxID=2555902 RepID=A0A964T7J1_9HYPH|nr:ornithine cyclodeaminase family protein [Propylenella binzhouense]MYZ49337.1 ornithine cyclodeaminase family protein [Propylenella binzhouense]